MRRSLGGLSWNSKRYLPLKMAHALLATPLPMRSAGVSPPNYSEGLTITQRRATEKVRKTSEREEKRKRGREGLTRER
jgi:hypothetical protein